MSEHTKEPWFEVETESDVIEITNDERYGAIVPIAEVSTGFNGQIGIEQEANARRIVACVNACAGIPTELLEKRTDMGAAEVRAIYTAMLEAAPQPEPLSDKRLFHYAAEIRKALGPDPIGATLNIVALLRAIEREILGGGE